MFFRLVAVFGLVGGGYLIYRRFSTPDILVETFVPDYVPVEGIDYAAKSENFVPAYVPVEGVDYSTRAVSFGAIGDNFLTSLGEIVKSIFTLPSGAEPYKEAIRQAEVLNGIPDGMLGRLLYQESHFRADIITGKVRSPVGAVGIAQFMPATARDLGVDPLNPFASIAAAGQYLAQLKNMTGTWEQALAAYNWGVGNVKRKGLAKAPKETRDYVSQIMADLGLA